MIKLQQYYIIKTTSKRLKNAHYSITLDIKQARKNGELVSIGESQMIRSLFGLTGRNLRHQDVNNLFDEKNKIKNKKATIENSHRLLDIEKEIDNKLFIPEICSVVIESNKQYEHMIKYGFFINGIKFVRLLCGSGQSRRNTVFFVDEKYEQPLKKLLNNDRNNDVEIAPAKFNAYFALCSSATLPVSEPYFCVVKDCEISKKEKVEFVEETDFEDNVYETELELPFNLFDGMGLISPKQAQQWASDLDLDYIPSTFIIRNNFMKGMLCVFDFHEFAEIHGEKYFSDVWGNNVNVLDIDIVLSESQLKLWNTFDSCADYIDKCRKNGWGWGVSRYSPKEDSKYVFSNYQFIQVENLSDKQIENICEKTIKYFNNTIRDDIDYTLLYLLGKNSNKAYDENILDKINDNVTKALIYNNELISDPFVHNHIVRSMNKKIRESYIGNLLLNGNYQTMINDPYAMAEHIFGMEAKGLLGDKEHYASYWNKQSIKTVAAFRAPLTWKSEVNILNLQQNDVLNYWYRYITSGIIYNIHGYDSMLHADSDTDGDIVMTTDQQELIDGAGGGLPITYHKNKVPKEIIDENTLYESDIKSFNTRIGFITNCSTTLYSMLPMFEENSSQYKEIIKRLKICRKEQGNQIDKAKGLIVKPFPSHWTKWTHPQIDWGAERKSLADFHNSILIDKRPYFMRWLYTDYNRKYMEYNTNFDNYSIAHFNTSLQDLLKKDVNLITLKEKEFIDKYYMFNPLLDTECIMNKICHHMEKSIHQLKENATNRTTDENIMMLKDKNIPFDEHKFKQLYDLYKKYKNGRQNFATVRDENGEEKYKTLEQYNKSVRQESYNISSNIRELANLAISICYEVHPNDNKSFAWNVFGEGIIENIKLNNKNNILVPFIDSDGNIEYLGNKYSKQVINIEEYSDVNFL